MCFLLIELMAVVSVVYGTYKLHGYGTGTSEEHAAYLWHRIHRSPDQEQHSPYLQEVKL